MPGTGGIPPEIILSINGGRVRVMNSPTAILLDAVVVNNRHRAGPQPDPVIVIGDQAVVN